MVATRRSRFLSTAPAAGLSLSLIISSLGCGGSPPNSTTPPSAKTLASVSMAPSSASIAFAATQQFTATAKYSDNTTADISTTANWASSTPAVATINSSGLATAAASGSTTITASLNGMQATATLNVGQATRVVTAIAVSPASSSISVGATQQLNATATYNDGSTGNVNSTATWTSSAPAVATVNSSGLATGLTSGSTTITASLNGLSGSGTLNVQASISGVANVPLWHFDAQRSGLNPQEGSLTPANVGPQAFGKLFSYLVDGYVYGQPLLVSNLTVNGTAHNVLFAATEKNSVYAFDADTYGSGKPLWSVSLLQAGETPLTNGPIQPYQGITSTPAIDLTSNTMYVVSTQTSAGGSSFRLNALDITSGAQKFGGPITIQASVPGTNSDSVNGIVSLTTSCLQRAALLVANGSVFIGFGGCHSGWLLSYDAQTLAQTGVFNSSPNLNGEGKYGGAGGVWMGGAGPAADDSGNVYVTTGNGPYDGQTSFGDSILKFDSQLHLLDHFTPDGYQFMNCQDEDLAAGGLLLIPGSLEALAGGKTGKLYLVNTSGLGGQQANDTGATQTLWFESDLVAPYSASCTDSQGTWTTDINSYEIFGTAAYFNGSVYLGITPTTSGTPGGVRQFSYSGLLRRGIETSQNILTSSYGTTPFLSANGTTNGILWMIDHGQPIQSGTQTTATLRAYDAANLATELYNSGQNSGDAPGYGIKFTSPIVANGKVYMATGHDPVTVASPQGELDVYGLK